jgi:hypothetical protein
MALKRITTRQSSLSKAPGSQTAFQSAFVLPGRLPHRRHRSANATREIFCGQLPAESDDPVSELAVCDRDAGAVHFQERKHRDKRQALVAVEERLALGDTLCEDRGLRREIGALIVRVSSWPADGALEALTIAELVVRLRRGSADDRGEQPYDILDRQIDRLEVACLRHARYRERLDGSGS